MPRHVTGRAPRAPVRRFYKNDRAPRTGVVLGTPVNPTGQIRWEWHNAWAALVIPHNWTNSFIAPMGYLVGDAQNIIAHEALAHRAEWLILIEDDNLIPPDLLIKFQRYMERGEDRSTGIPVVSGLYHLKGMAPPEPLMYRGRGTGAYKRWAPGDKVWVDGVPTGCVLIHMSLIEALAETAETYTLHLNRQPLALKRIFWQPCDVTFTDGDLATYQKIVGTTDLNFCRQILDRKILAKTGWTSVARRTYPFLVDTSIKVGHIDRDTGMIW